MHQGRAIVVHRARRPRFSSNLPRVALTLLALPTALKLFSRSG
jgi:hypothetical protein